MGRDKNKKKESNRRYYLEKIKPKRKLQPPYVMLRCPLCSLLSHPSSFEKAFEPKAVFRFGNQFQVLSRAQFGDTAYEYGMEIYLRTMQAIIYKDLLFLKECIRGGLITKEKIAGFFDIQQVQVLKTVEGFRSAPSFSIPHQLSGSNQLSVSRIATFNPLQQIRKSPNLISPNYMRGVRYA